MLRFFPACSFFPPASPLTVFSQTKVLSLFLLCFVKTPPLHKGTHQKYSEGLFEDLPHIYEAFEAHFVSKYTIFCFHANGSGAATDADVSLFLGERT